MAHLTPDEILQSSTPDPLYLEAYTNSPIHIAAPSFFAIRANRANHLAQLRHLYPIPGPIPNQVAESLHDVPTRDGTSIRVKVYKPVRGPPEGGSPLILMFHEGGWCMGDLTDEEVNCRMFVRELGAVCVNVEYRLAPEHKFPTGVNDCWDALIWAINPSTALDATPSQGLILGGASAGGNIAAVLALQARNVNLSPPITGQYLCVPALLPTTVVPARYKNRYLSRTTNLSDPVIGKLDDESGIMKIYAPDPHSPLWVPFNHPGGHVGAPPAFFQVAGMDPLRDEAILYDELLRESGVLTRFELYAGYGHMFWTNYPHLEKSKAFVRDTLRGVRWLLQKGALGGRL